MSYVQTSAESILDVVEDVLRQETRPMTALEISKSIRESPKRKNWLKGNTPHKTIQARLSTDILNNSRETRFYRYAPAVYGLKDRLESGDYPRQYLRKYIFWRRRRRELENSYIARINVDFTAFLNRGGFLDREFFPLNILRHLDIRLVDRKNIDKDKDSYNKLLRYYYCFRHEDKIVRYRRSNFDMNNEGRDGELSVGFDGWITENHLSLFSSIGFDIEPSVLADAYTIFDSQEKIDVQINFIGFLNDSTDRKNKHIIALVFDVQLEDFFEFDEIKGVRDLEWISLMNSSNRNVNLESWSKYLLSEMSRKFT
jgi:predicted NUDIX family phosphoesterase